MSDQRGINGVTSRQQKTTTKRDQCRKQHNPTHHRQPPHDFPATHRSSTEAAPVAALTGHNQQGFTIALLYFADQNSH
jgi:hypothetical protein